jgi:hypothetical protein
MINIEKIKKNELLLLFVASSSEIKFWFLISGKCLHLIFVYSFIYFQEWKKASNFIIFLIFFPDFSWFQTKWGFVYKFPEPWVYCKITWTYCKKWQSTNHHGLCR